MGTNYYLHKDACECCGRSDDVLHIGKSSVGWCFGLHIHPDEGITTLADWQELFEQHAIVDEYGARVTAEDMLATIKDRGREPKWDEKPYMYESWAEFHRMNHSMEGPNGLLRSKIEHYCVGHGEGTWDYFIGEFS